MSHVEGLDKIMNDLLNLPKQAINDIQNWLEIIGKTAKELCNDPDCKRIKLKMSEDGVNITYIFDENDTEAMNCIIKAIETHYDSLPIGLQPTFKKIVEDIKTKKQNSEKTKSSF
jgi:hypothetical protein